MRKLIVPAFISLDGVMQAPGGPGEDTSGGFIHGGWIWPFAGESDEVMGGVFERPFELLLGRRTFDIFAAYWPHVAEDAPHRGIADMFNGTAKHVATHHPGTLAWRNSHALGTDIATAVRTLKRSDGPNLVTQGSSDLVHQLLGHGKRLFDDHGRASAFRLEQSKATSRGVLVNRYLRAGDVQTGSFE